MKDSNIIDKTIEFIEDNLHQELNLDDIAEKVNYSKFHLNRLFYEQVGSTIYKYIQMRRVTEAAKQLVKTQNSIVEIAYDANYSSQQAFTLAFRQIYHCTPQTYRAIGIFTPKQNRFSMKVTTFTHNGMSMCRGGRAA